MRAYLVRSRLKMKLIKPILCCCLLSMAFSLSAESRYVSANVDSVRMFDEYGDIPFRNEKARLKNLAHFISRDAPTSVAYILVYGGRRSCRNEAQLRANRAKNYLLTSHRIPAERIITVDGGYREELTVELFIVSGSATAPYAAATVDASEVEITGDCGGKNNNRKRHGNR